MWAIDQIIRILAGKESKYDSLIEEFEGTDKNGDPMYEWDVGIAP